MARERDPPAPQGTARAERHQYIKSQHGGRKHNRQGHHCFDQKLPAPAREGNPPGDRQAKHKQYGRYRDCQLQSQPECLPVDGHGRFSARPNEFPSYWGSVKPYFRNNSAASFVLMYSRNCVASFLCCECESNTAPCARGGYASAGTSQYFPLPRILGVTAWAKATNATCALPDSTNCAACEMLSPKTRRSATRSYMPECLRAATAARP